MNHPTIDRSLTIAERAKHDLWPHLVVRCPRPLLLCDMDGPLADFDTHFWKRCRDEGWSFDIEHAHEQRHRYFTEHMPNPVEKELAEAMIRVEGWFADLPVVPGSQDGIEALIDAGVDVWVCTKPMEDNLTCASDKMNWIAEFFPALRERIIITSNKGLVVGDVLLDDAPNPNWYQYAGWLPVIYAAGYNGGGTEWDQIPRFKWGDPIEDLITLIDMARKP